VEVFDMNSFVDVLKALSDVNRLRIMVTLLKSGKELCICEIMDTLDIAQYNASRYVKELRTAGLLEERREGRFVCYSVSNPQTDTEKYLLKTLGTLEGGIIAEDRKRLAKRLAMRENGKCVIGMRESAEE